MLGETSRRSPSLKDSHIKGLSKQKLRRSGLNVSSVKRLSVKRPNKLKRNGSNVRRTKRPSVRKPSKLKGR